MIEHCSFSRRTKHKARRFQIFVLWTFESSRQKRIVHGDSILEKIVFQRFCLHRVESVCTVKLQAHNDFDASDLFGSLKIL